MFLFQERDVTQVGSADAVYFFLSFSFCKAKVVKQMYSTFHFHSMFPQSFKSGLKNCPIVSERRGWLRSEVIRALLT